MNAPKSYSNLSKQTEQKKEKKPKRNKMCDPGGGCRRAGKGIFLRAGQRSGVGTPQTRQRGPWDHSKACWVCVLSQQQKLLSQYMNHCLRCWSYNDTAEFSRFRYFNNTFFMKIMCKRHSALCCFNFCWGPIVFFPLDALLHATKWPQCGIQINARKDTQDKRLEPLHKRLKQFPHL